MMRFPIRTSRRPSCLAFPFPTAGSNHIGHDEEQTKVRGERQEPLAIPDVPMGR